MKRKQATKPTAFYYVLLSLMTGFFLYFTFVNFLEFSYVVLYKQLPFLSDNILMLFGIPQLGIPPLLLICYAVIAIKYCSVYGKLNLHLSILANVLVFCIAVNRNKVFTPLNLDHRQTTIISSVAMVAIALTAIALPWIKLIIDKRREHA